MVFFSEPTSHFSNREFGFSACKGCCGLPQLILIICFSSFGMFYSFAPYSDLIFQDAAQQLQVIPTHQRHYHHYLGKTFLRNMALVDCTAGAVRWELNYIHLLPITLFLSSLLWRRETWAWMQSHFLIYSHLQNLWTVVNTRAFPSTSDTASFPPDPCLDELLLGLSALSLWQHSNINKSCWVLVTLLWRRPYPTGFYRSHALYTHPVL